MERLCLCMGLICLSGVHFAPIKIGMKDFEKWLVPVPDGDRNVRIGAVELVVSDMDFENSFLDIYNGVIDFINGNLEPSRHFRLIFNQNILNSIKEVIFPVRYKEFLADAVEGNTVLYKMLCLIQRRIYLDSSHDYSGILQCWRKMHSFIYNTNSESQFSYETEDQVIGNSCREFFNNWYPDVSWDVLPAWEVSLDPSQVLQKKRLLKIRNDKLHGLRTATTNYEETLLQFYACTHTKISLLQDATMRFCYQKTLDSNMHSFLGNFLWRFPDEYTALKDLFLKLAANIVNNDNEFAMRDTNPPVEKNFHTLDTMTSPHAARLSDNETQKARVRKDLDSITVQESLEESIAYQRKMVIFVGVAIFVMCVILAVIITKIVLCCKDFRIFYRGNPEPLEEDFKHIEGSLEQGKSDLEFRKSRHSQSRQKTTQKMKSMSDVNLPISDNFKPLPDEMDPLIKTSFNNPGKPITPKKKK